MRTRPGEMVENLGKNWRISMKRKKLKTKRKYKFHRIGGHQKERDIGQSTLV